jgi:hypothetical protein
MKRVVWALIVLLMSAGSECLAQWNKGSFLVGGSVSYNREQVRESTNPNELDNLLQSEFSLTPYIGYFFADKWAAGIAPSYQNIRRTGDKLIFNGLTNIPYEVDATSDTFTGGVFLRRYFPVTDNFTFFLHGQFNAGETNVINIIYANGVDISDSDNTTRLLSGALRPGIAFFPTKNFSIESFLGLLEWERTRYRPIQDGVSTGIETSTNVNMNLNPVRFNLTFLYFFNIRD